MKGSFIWVITSVPTELDSELREIISKKSEENRMKKGDLRLTVIEAVEEWIKKQKYELTVK